MLKGMALVVAQTPWSCSLNHGADLMEGRQRSSQTNNEIPPFKNLTLGWQKFGFSHNELFS